MAASDRPSTGGDGSGTADDERGGPYDRDAERLLDVFDLLNPF